MKYLLVVLILCLSACDNSYYKRYFDTPSPASERVPIAYQSDINSNKDIEISNLKKRVVELEARVAEQQSLIAQLNQSSALKKQENQTPVPTQYQYTAPPQSQPISPASTKAESYSSPSLPTYIPRPTSSSYSSSYIRGPRGGCYTYSGSGRKRYVDRSLCN